MPFKKGKSGNEQTMFKPGQTGNPKGRPVKIFSEIAADWRSMGIERATPERVIEAFEYLMALPQSELTKLSVKTKQDENADELEYPALIQIAASEMLGKRKREILSDMLDRAHGKATNRQEVSGKNGGAIKVGLDISALSLEEKVKLLELAKKARNG